MCMKGLAREDIEELIPYSPGKPLEEVEREYGIKNPVKLASNENCLGASPKAVEAIRQSLEKIHRYPDGSGFYLKEKLAQKLRVKKENIILGNGSNEIIEAITRTFLRPKEETIIPDPTFLLYRMMIQRAYGNCVRIPLNNFAYNLSEMAGRISPSTKLIFINTPNNPTGSIISEKDFEDFLNRIPEKVILVIDEAYGEYATDKDYPNFLNDINEEKKIIILRTFSKIYGLAGLRIGYGIGDERLIAYLNRLIPPFSVNYLAQIGALAALDDKEHLKKSRDNNQKGLAYLYREIADMGLDYVPTQANFFLIHTGGDGDQIYRALLEEGVIVRSMSAFGIQQYIRITVGQPWENRRFIEALKKILK